MTAIFMVWNSTGLAIAADQSASVSGLDENGNRRVLFTENHKKIIKPSNFNFAIAAAGSSTINNVLIEGIVNQWVKTIQVESSMFDYVHSFIAWMANQSNLEDCARNYEYSRFRIRLILNTFRDEFKEKQIVVKHEEHIDSKFEKWKGVDLPNFFGQSLQRSSYSEINEDLKSVHNDFLLHMNPLNFIEETRNIEIENLKMPFAEEFEKVFGEELDLSKSWHVHLQNHIINYVIDYADEAWNYSHLMFAGYGDSDWMPICIKIKVFDFDTGIPIIVIDDASDPSEVWYEELAQDDAVNKFFRPVDRSARVEISNRLVMNFANDEIHRDIDSVIDSVLDEYSSSTTDLVLKKINQLSVEKLQFIAEHMVAMESFRSYIEEYLPTVGGQIDCVKITRVDGEYS